MEGRRRITAGGGEEYWWCYKCNKRVSIESNQHEELVECLECKYGFVELLINNPSIASTTTITPLLLDPDDDDVVDDHLSFGSHFLHMRRFISTLSSSSSSSSNNNNNINDDDYDVSPPPPPGSRSQDDDFLRIQIEPYDDDHDDDEVHFNNDDHHQSDDGEERYVDNDEDDDDDDEREHDLLRRSSDILRLPTRDFATRSTSGRNRILDWADILMGLQVPPHPSDTYVGNPDDYVDAAADFEALLHNLADGGRRGAPPASKEAVSRLPVFEVIDDAVACAVCKDVITVGEFETKLPCGHVYHRDCIVPWLGSRNSCPVCRFELPTDDVEYEEDRKKRATSGGGGGASGSSSSSS